MQLAVGDIIEGKVTGITKFGAFVEISQGVTGMVHISEVSSTYVKEIRDFLTENQVVKVKVMSISDDGKISLSVKKVQEASAPQPNRQEGGRGPRPQRGAPRGYGYNPNKSSEPQSFEDMLSKFKQTSDDKMSDLKKTTDVRRSRRGSR